jgi:hypothetical protein
MTVKSHKFKVLGTKNTDFKLNKFELCIFYPLSVGPDASDKYFTRLEINSTVALKLRKT